MTTVTNWKKTVPYFFAKYPYQVYSVWLFLGFRSDAARILNCLHE